MSWKDIFIDFIIKLLKSEEFNIILNIIDRLIKKRHYIIYITINENMIAENTAKILYKNVWRIHDLSSIIILNRDPQFMSII